MRAGPVGRGKVVLGAALLLGGLAVATIVVLAVGTVVYPGSLKLTAPILCPDDQPDAYVVRTTVQDSEGTSTNFTLFCMGERGDFSEAGSWRPLGVLFAGTYMVLLVVVGGFGWRVARRASDRLPAAAQ